MTFTSLQSYRYEEANVRASSMYKPYLQDLPLFLHNRPPKFINHCAARLPPQVKDIPAANIMEVNATNFTVASVDTPGQVYKIDLGSGCTLPRCTCLDFENTGWLCKHFLALFAKCPNVTWDSLPAAYTKSPVFNLDHDVVGLPDSCQNSMNNDTRTNPDLRTRTTKDCPVIPRKQPAPSQNLAIRVRSVLHCMKNMTYRLEDEKDSDTLRNVLTALNRVRQMVPQPEKELKRVFNRRKIHKVAPSLLRKYKSRRKRKIMGHGEY